MIGVLAEFDKPYMRSKRFIVGVDEAGRGALAGDVVAAAVSISDKFYEDNSLLKSLEKLNDSKKLSEETRKELFKKLSHLKRNGVLDFEAGIATVEEIEKFNILGATKIAMRRALDAVNVRGNLSLANSSMPATLFGEGGSDLSRAEVLIDGIKLKNFPYRHFAIVKGDASSLAIAAASIVAKVTRDEMMEKLALKYPRYGFEIHKGYGTPLHLQNILIYGASPAHRPSFLKKLRDETPKPKQAELF